jgi:XTP/dITP diphosphohydrolase
VIKVPLVLATQNVHKVRELRAMLKQLPELDLLSLADFPQYTAPEEIGSSFEENATIKALHASNHLNLWALADDSGLVVAALQGAPGIFSARYAGRGASDGDNRKKLLEEMRHLQDEERTAHQECWLVLASPRGIEKAVQGICEGSIAMRERGGSGFGYDPLFIKHGYGKTFAELEETIKNRVSHRRKALDKIMPFLQNYIRACIT